MDPTASFALNPADRDAVREAYELAAARFQECVAWDIAAEALRARHEGLSLQRARGMVLPVLAAHPAAQVNPDSRRLPTPVRASPDA